jgi:hypothetical protein
MPWGSSRQDSLQAALDDVDRKTEAAQAEEEIREHVPAAAGAAARRGPPRAQRSVGRHEELRQQCLQGRHGHRQGAGCVPADARPYDQSFLTKSPEYQTYFKTLVDQHKPLQGMLESATSTSSPAPRPS